MYGSRRVTERTSLTRPMDEPDYVEFASLLRTRRSRIKHFQCCICATFIAIFTMALVVTISYSVNQDIIDTASNLTGPESGAAIKSSGFLKLGYPIESGSYTLLSNTVHLPDTNVVFASGKSINSPTMTLSDKEFKEGLKAGQDAINARLSANVAAAASPLPSPSPEARHRFAVKTRKSVGALTLAAIAEIAATKKIENSRSILGEPSSIGSFFDGGWIPDGICKEFQVRNCTINKYRTFDGTCNRPLQWGSSMMPFRRALAPSYADGIDLPRKALSGKELPSAREISLKVHKPSPSSNPAFTVMLAVYGQFLDHDITATAISQGVNGSSLSCCPPSVGHPECFPVPVATGDPVFDVAGRTCMEFVRSAPAPQCMLGPREQLNQVTAFIDGSTIYGSDVQTAMSLRAFVGGRLRMQVTPDNRTLLPPSMNPNDGCNRETERLRGRYCFAAGDARANENLHLTTMHLLWARQHNKIVEQLAKVNPTWSDEVLYQEGRRIVGAQLQHITYQEFLPIILGEQETNLHQLKPLKLGYRELAESPDITTNNPTIANNFATAAFRFAHTLLPGLMKMTNEQEGTSSYVELHRMLFNPYSLYSEDGVKNSVTSATSNVIQMTTTHVTSQLTSHLFEDPISNVTVPCGLDLVSLNIQRGRDHGLPGYTKWREFCGLGKVEAFSDLQGHLDPQVLEQISTLYESVHDVDLYTGALGELPKPDGIVGPTFSCLITDQFIRLQRGDRFWYEVPGRPYSFTEGQLQELRKTSLARLICDCSDGVTQIQAAVMRSIGPENPMMSCEDIAKPSFESWEADAPAKQFLKASLIPFDWIDLKKNINSTIFDIVTFINSTKATVTPATTDWLSFRDYINDTFNDLRNEFAGLHPPKVTETSTMNSNFNILQATAPVGLYQDWINFKIDLIKSLNNSMGAVGGGPAAAVKWMEFKQSIISQFADLKNQVTLAKAEVIPKLLMAKYKQEQSLINQKNNPTELLKAKESAVPLSVIFDWKNFKSNIIQSLDDAIMNIGDNMPPPGDPAWTTFGDDINNRFTTLRDKIKSQVTTLPTELAGNMNVAGDWLAYKADVINTVNNAVKQIEDGMPPPGDPAWPAYRDQVMKSFSTFDGKPSITQFATSPALSASAVSERAGLFPTFTTNEFANLTNDWLDFRTKLNDSLTRIIEDIQSKKPTTIDPIGWVAFKGSAMNDFAQLKNEISDMKAEWIMEINKLKGNTTSLPISGEANKVLFDLPKFKDPTAMKPTIPFTEWIDFKKEINETVMNFLNAAKTTEKIDFDELHEIFNKSFTDLKNDIVSLKDLVAKDNSLLDDSKAPTDSVTAWNKTAIDWIDFRTKFNSTISGLIDSLKNESVITIGNMMKILFETKDKLSDLEPPSSSANIPAADWIHYTTGINQTVADTLKSVNDVKRITLMIKAANPAVSSSKRLTIVMNWLLFPCVTISLHLFLPMSGIKISSRW